MSILNHFPRQTFYPNQREALLQIEEGIKSGKRFILLEMGTGGGKSVIMYTTSRLLGTAHIVVMQHVLQEQYVNTLKLPFQKGRGASYCKYWRYRKQDDVRCDSGKCITDKKFRCEFKPILKSSVIVNDFICEHYSRKVRPEVYKAFERFGLTSEATEEELKTAFRKLVLIHHPDVGGDPEEFILDKSNFELAKENIQVIQAPQEIAKIRVEKNYACTSSRGDMFWQGTDHCNYWQQKCECIASPIVVHNYPYLIGESNFVGDFGTRALLGCDEAHNLDKVISDFVKIIINQSDLDLVKMTFVNCGKEIVGWIPFLTSFRSQIINKFRIESDYLEVFKEAMTDQHIVDEKEVLVTKLEEILNKLDEFLHDYNTHQDNWTISINYFKGNIDKIELKPTYIGEYAERLLFKLGNQVLLMSATIIDPITYCQELGIPLNQVHYINVPSSFPPERSPVYPMNIGKINAKNFEENIGKVIKVIEEIFNIHEKQKGIVHCVSNNVRNLILANIGNKYKNRLLVPTAGNKKVILDKHTKSENSILLSISDEEGLDLFDDLSRFCITPTLPFGSLGDPRVAKKSDADKIREEEARQNGIPFISRYEIDMMRRLIQQSGRSTRSPTDYSFHYILPSTLNWYIQKFNKYFEYRGFWPSPFVNFKNRIKRDKDGYGRNVI